MEGGMQTFAVRGNGEDSAPHVLSPQGKGLPVVQVDSALDVDGLAVLVVDLEGHAVFDTVDEVSAFRVEFHHQIVFLLAGKACLWSLVHVAGIVVAGFFGLAVDGQHTAIEPVPHTVVVGGHLLVIEPPRLFPAVIMLPDVEVQVPAGVGTQLIVAAIERVRQLKLAAGVAGRADDDGLTLYEHAVGRQQLHVEQATHIGWLEVVGTHHVCLVP